MFSYPWIVVKEVFQIFMSLFRFSCIGTSHLLNPFLFDVNCAIMLSVCLPLILSFLQFNTSIISYFYHLLGFVSIACSPLLIKLYHIVSYNVSIQFLMKLFPSCRIRSFMQSWPLIRLIWFLDLPLYCAFFYLILWFQICLVTVNSIFT